MLDRPIFEKRANLDGRDENAEIESLIKNFGLQSSQFFSASSKNSRNLRYLFSSHATTASTVPKLIEINDRAGRYKLRQRNPALYHQGEPKFLLGVFFHVSRHSDLKEYPLLETSAKDALLDRITNRDAQLDGGVTPVTSRNYTDNKPVAGYFMTPRFLMSLPNVKQRRILAP